MLAAIWLRKTNIEERLLIVLDPPRQGIDAAVPREMARLKPFAVIYVSCNPMTFQRDAEKLRFSGLRLRRVQGFDMFPQTDHVELMALFQKS